MRSQLTTSADKVAFPLMGAEAVAVATGDDTAGAWEAMELTLAGGARSPRHTVPADKVFYVVAGTVGITLGDDRVDAPAGGFVHVPAGTPHNYQNTSGTTARLLVITTGGGHVDFLRGMSALTAGGARPDPQRLAEHTARHGVRLLPA